MENGKTTAEGELGKALVAELQEGCVVGNWKELEERMGMGRRGILARSCYPALAC